jgi:putative DNA primase/helicase
MMQANSGGASPPNAKPHQRANWQGLGNQNQQTNYSKSAADCLHELRNVMLATIGSAPDYLSASGKLTRFDTLKKGDKAGWYVAHLTRWGMVARFGDWHDGYPHHYTSFEANKLNKQDLAELKKLQQQQAQARQIEQEAAHNAAQAKAIERWTKARPASHAHPYLMRKQIQAHGVRQLGDLLLVPIHDLEGQLLNLQTIATDGQKRFLTGGRKRGLGYLMGAMDNAKTLIICEGFATGASLYEAYQQPVLVAFDAGNLLPVAQAYRNAYPYLTLIIGADNDRSKPINTGVIKAKEVQAKVTGVDVIIPDFPPRAPANLSDFNDLANWISMEATV